MSKIQKSLDEEKTVTLLIAGTENRDIFILEQTGMAIKKHIQLKSVPVQIDASGQFDIESKLYVACRDGKVYVIRNCQIQDVTYSIESKPVGMVRLDKTIVLAGMN